MGRSRLLKSALDGFLERQEARDAALAVQLQSLQEENKKLWGEVRRLNAQEPPAVPELQAPRVEQVVEQPSGSQLRGERYTHTIIFFTLHLVERRSQTHMLVTKSLRYREVFILSPASHNGTIQVATYAQNKLFHSALSGKKITNKHACDTMLPRLRYRDVFIRSPASPQWDDPGCYIRTQ
jgi:hypothetical protein